MRRTALAAALIPCALLLTACGSKSASTVSVSTAGSSASEPSNAGLTQAQLKSRLQSALSTATAVHFKGTMSDSGTAATMDLQINRDGSTQGTIVSGGMTMPMIVVGGVSYVQITSSFESEIKAAAAEDPSAVSQIVVGKWISSKSALGSSVTGGLGDMTDFSAMTKDLATTSGDKFSYLGTSTVKGEAVAQYKDVSTDGGTTSTATMDIPLHGSPLPIEEDAGSQGAMFFTWNEPTKVTAPAAADVVSLPTS